LASLARREVPFSRLFLAVHHFETCRNCDVSNGAQPIEDTSITKIVELNIRIWRTLCGWCGFGAPTSCALRGMVRGSRCRVTECWRRVRGFRGRNVDIGRAVVRSGRRCHCDGSTHNERGLRGRIDVQIVHSRAKSCDLGIGWKQDPCASLGCVQISEACVLCIPSSFLTRDRVSPVQC
jgi:hypothetical protein